MSRAAVVERRQRAPAEPAPARSRGRRPTRARGSQACLDAAAAAGPALPFPHRHVLERRLGHSLADVRVYANADSRAALDALDADAAIRRRALFLRTPDPGIAVVAHEAVHLVQASGTQQAIEAASEAQPAGETGPGETATVPAEAAPAEREARRLAPLLARPPQQVDRPEHPVPVTATLDRAAVATLRRSPTGGEPAPVPTDTVSVAAFTRHVATPTPATADAVLAPPTPAPTPESRELPAPESARADVIDPAPPAPALTIDPTAQAAVAQQQAVTAAAEAALTSAGSPEQLLDAFATAPPSVKAARTDALGPDLQRTAQEHEQSFRNDLPEITATLQGDPAAPPPLRVEAPAAATVVLEAATPAPAPDPDIPRTPDLPPANANPQLLSGLTRLSGAEPAARAQDLGQRISAVATTDPALPSVGPPPRVPLAGASDPNRIDEQVAAGSARARQSLEAAHTAVLTGPGPEQVQPVQVAETHRIEGQGLPEPALATPEVPAGPERFAAMNLPPEVQARFDQQQHATMQASLDGARGQAAAAATERDTKRSTELEKATGDAEKLSRTAEEEQRTHVGSAREDVQRARRDTLAKQSSAVADVERDAGDRRSTDQQAVRTRVAADEAAIESRYRRADEDAQREIDKGERRAQAEQERAEREAEDQSWWDRAVDFVAAALNALKDAINAVIDAVRDAINSILDAVKAFATALIDAVATFINEAIAAFGTFLKGLVDTLLGELFPELAAALNAAIDKAVSAAQRAVSAVAEGLKKAVTALVDGLRAVLNAILNVYQAAMNLALGVVTAAITGDWAALARMVLEAVLGVLGVDPAEFYAFVGRAEATFQAILDDPGAFLSNLVDAFVGGVRLFAGNFLTHLQAGVIAWLTGALGGAGLTLPKAFDLMGVLDLLRQIVGLTWERLRERAVRIVGPKAVELLEQLNSYLDTLITGGWSALFERLRDDLSGLADTVLDGLKSMLLERLVMAAITRLATLFNPVGALVQLVLAAWNFYTFLRDPLKRILEVVKTVIGALAQIVAGMLRPASLAVEEVLGRLLPLALDFLARLLGLGDIGGRVRELLTKAQATVDRAIDKLLQRGLAALRGGRSAKAAAGTPQAGDGATVRADVTSALLAELDENHTRTEVEATAQRIADRFRPRGLHRIELGKPDADGDYPVLVEASALAPAVVMRLARKGASVRMASALRFSTPQTLQTPREFVGSPVKYPGVKPGAPEDQRFVRRAPIGVTGGYLLHPQPGAKRDTSRPEPEQITSELVQVTNYNYARSDRRESSNDSHAERHFMSWFDADVAKASRPHLEKIEVKISRSPCSLCSRHSPANLPAFLNRVRRDALPGQFAAFLEYSRPHEGDYPTTREDIAALRKAWDRVDGPAINLTDEQAGRQSRHAVPVR